MEKPTLTASNPPKARNRNSGLIEKLQANLVLSPSSMVPLVQIPQGKLQPRPRSASRPSSPLHNPSNEGLPVSFQEPAEGAVLTSFNKGRARLSVKRRPPTRQHRKSYTEEQNSEGATSSFLQKSQEKVPVTSLETIKADSPTPTSKAKKDKDSLAGGIMIQDGGSISSTESMKEVISEKTPAEVCSTHDHEPQPMTSLGISAEDMENQPKILGD